ncbi:hypothetical protein Fmac_000795 [Flemingia macrophylla]|uniref:Tryptophan synthase beta chain-like PALP domain-containing protein n=1 Tax=Flemingia macrophylla TaxID=520843 RepID=A0ABD1NF92_9FABA
MDALRVTPTPAPLLHRHPLREMARYPVLLHPCLNPFVVATVSKPLEAAVAPPRPRVSSDSLQYPPCYLGVVPCRSHSETSESVMNDAMGYLTNILSSKVYDVAMESPLQLAPKLSEKLGVRVWLKREDLQPVFSFKRRGAYNMMSKLPSEMLVKAVICSSAGNHAQGVALISCQEWKYVEVLGARLVLVGDSYDETQAYAEKLALEEGRAFIHPFDHPDVIMGQGTNDQLHAIFVPVGGGGLIAGIAAYVKRVSPEVKIIGVEPTDANAMALSLHHDQRVVLDQVGGFADGVAVGEETFRICKELIDGIVLVSRDSICASIKDMFEEKRNILEPAGALALAGAEAYCKYHEIQGENIVVITSGANMNFDKLKVVTELANVGRSKQEAVLAAGAEACMLL